MGERRRVRGVNSFVVLLIGGRAKWTNRHISCLAGRLGSNPTIEERKVRFHEKVFGAI
jgi:hypothetical protein